MSIMDSKLEYEAALKQGRLKYPPLPAYPNNPAQCNHDFSFIIYCDGGDWDIARCRCCGMEQVVHCTFDDDYD